MSGVVASSIAAHGRVAAASLALAAALLLPADAGAQLARRRFDPEDLKLEQPGTLHADLQLGVVRGPLAGRWVAPDFGVDLGLAENVELGVDGAFAVEGTPGAPYALDHRTADNVWLSTKLGLHDAKDDARGMAWAFGAQLGPKVAATPGARGTGFEGLMLVGRTSKKLQVVLNVGAFVDPGAEVARRRPAGIESGVDVEVALDGGGRWGFLADLSAVYFLSADPHQLQTTFGPQWTVGDALALSIQGLVGILPGNDRYGALLVVSPRLALLR